MSLSYRTKWHGDMLRSWKGLRFVPTAALEKALWSGISIIRNDGFVRNVAKTSALSRTGLVERGRAQKRARGGRRSLLFLSRLRSLGDAIRRVHSCGDLCGEESRMGFVEGNTLSGADRADCSCERCVGYGRCFALAAWLQ